MKNNVEAGSGKDQRLDNTFVARLTPSRLLVGVLSTTLLLLSLIGTIALVTSTNANVAGAALAANSVTNHSLFPKDTTTPTTTPSPTSTPSPTPTPTTPTPTATSTPTPTPTTAITPTPTPTSLPSPTPTSTKAPTPIPTSTPSLSPTRSTNTTLATATPNATVTVTTMPTQSSSQDQTPTTLSTSNTIQSASQDQQNGTFPFIALAIGVPGAIAAIGFFFIGWWLLRKRLLPVKKVKLPPSGANPWSRVRTSNPQLNTNVNAVTLPFGSNHQLSNNPAFWGHTSIAPTPYGSSQTYPQNNFAPGSQLSFNGVHQIQNTPVIPAPARPEGNGPQAMGNMNNESYGREESTYQQWLRNNPEGTSDINNPYLKEIIKQYSDKSRAAYQQKPSNTSNEHASPDRTDETWLR